MHLNPNYRASRNVGEANPLAKLTEVNVREMRELYARRVTITELAQQFDVSRNTARKAITRQTWKHVS